VIVKVDDPLAIPVGANTPVAPDGRPVVPKLTVDVNPPAVVIATLYVVEPPAATDCDDGVGVSE
jgi:hypothetical protein